MLRAVQIPWKLAQEIDQDHFPGAIMYVTEGQGIKLYVARTTTTIIFVELLPIEMINITSRPVASASHPKALTSRLTIVGESVFPIAARH